MASNVFTGQVQGISKIAAGTPAAFCRAITGGSVTISPNNIRKVGIGGQLHVRKGTQDVEMSVTCVGVARTDLALWFPTTAGVVVANFPDFLVEVDDGTNGQEWVLSGGQPGSVKMSCSDGPDAEVEYTFTMKFDTVTEQARGTKACVYNSLKGHTINDIAVAFAAAAQGCLSFELSNDLGIEMHNPADGKTAGSHTLPDGYYVTKNAPTFSCVTSNVFKGTAMDGDTWTAEDIVLTLANGTAGENITITLDDWVPESWNMPVEAEGRIGFAHEFAPGDGTIYNRVTTA